MVPLLPFLSFAFIVAASPLSILQINAQRSDWIGPLNGPQDPSGVVKDGYIVVLKEGLSPAQVLTHISNLQSHNDSLMAADGGLKHVYDIEGFKGYAGSFEPETLDLLRAQPEVEYVEKDTIVHTATTQICPPWGLARISHRPALTGVTSLQYEYDEDGGEGVNVYVIDTGIFIDHEEFQGRARWGRTMPKNDVDADRHGHGTHCAGIIASYSYGVAKKAHVIAVKVLGSNGSGTASDVIGGVQWACDDALNEKRRAVEELKATSKPKHKGSVINLSIGSLLNATASLNQAVDNAVLAGLHFAVAAGNEDTDACMSNPAAAKLAVKVGASTIADERAGFSNYGTCVDLFAPGFKIKSTWNAYGLMKVSDGTSMASAHVAGLMAYLLSIYPSKSFNPSVQKQSETLYGNAYQTLLSVGRTTFPGWMTHLLPSPTPSFDPFAPAPKIPELTPAMMKKALIKLSSKGLLADIPSDTPNLLIFNNATALTSWEEFWANLF